MSDYYDNVHSFPPGREPAPPYELFTADQIAARPPAKYRIKGVLMAEGVACIFGASSSGKSFLAMDMAVAVSDDLQWFGKRIKPCDVVWVCLEGRAGLEGRVKAFKKHYGQHAGQRIRFITDPFNLLFTDDLDRLIAAVQREEMDGGIIVIDTLNAATPGMDENSSEDMGHAIQAAKRIQSECGGLVLLIHHSGKDAKQGLRGHSSLQAALDTLIEVTKDNDYRTWTLKKSKDGADGESHSFRLDIVELGLDADGDPITSCVIGHDMPDTVPAPRRPIPPKSSNQRIIWEALGELFIKAHHFGKAQAPQGRPCLELEFAIDSVRGRLPVEPKRQTERARSSIQSLIAANHLNLADGWLWIP